MKTVCDNVNTIIIKNSKFITYLYNVNDVSQANEIISDIRNLHSDATHCCYAYIVGNNRKSSDDGEPGGTAGVPIMQVLEMNEVNNCLVIVVRYFGGIKLGAGGLVRAYAKCCRDVLESHIKELTLGYNVTISFEYGLVRNIDYILRDSIICSKDFNEDIVYNINCTIDIINKLKTLNIDIIINNEVYF